MHKSGCVQLSFQLVGIGTPIVLPRYYLSLPQCYLVYLKCLFSVLLLDGDMIAKDVISTAIGAMSSRSNPSPQL